MQTIYLSHMTDSMNSVQLKLPPMKTQCGSSSQFGILLYWPENIEGFKISMSL